MIINRINKYGEIMGGHAVAVCGYNGGALYVQDPIGIYKPITQKVTSGLISYEGFLRGADSFMGPIKANKSIIPYRMGKGDFV